MAMLDYGAIAWKDGKLISTDMFTDMKDMVGWDDSNIETKSPLVNNYFAYVGDEDFTLAFYKYIMRIYNPTFTYDNEEIFFGSEQKRFHNYYVCHMKYKGHKYKVAFGYGVDLDCYKKWHMIDYYGTPWYRIMSEYRDFKYWLRDLKWRWGR